MWGECDLMIVKSAGYYVYRTHTIAAHERRTVYNSPRDRSSQDFNDLGNNKSLETKSEICPFYWFTLNKNVSIFVKFCFITLLVKIVYFILTH